MVKKHGSKALEVYMHTIETCTYEYMYWITVTMLSVYVLEYCYDVHCTGGHWLPKHFKSAYKSHVINSNVQVAFGDVDTVQRSVYTVLYISTLNV